jgi:hypothetical protein
MSNINPMLQTAQWTREDMAVAQDWELERGNEGVLLWTDLGPELARMVCENPGVLAGVLSPERATTWTGTLARMEGRVCAGVGTWLGLGEYTLTQAEVHAGKGRRSMGWGWGYAQTGRGIRSSTKVEVGGYCV